MNIGLIGLGKMGYQLALNMLDNDMDFIAYNRTQHKLDKIHKEGVIVAYTLEELVSKLSKPRVLWLMIPAGDPVDTMLKKLSSLLSTDDIIIDGGNSNYKDTLRRYDMLKTKKIHYVDVGTSGGVEGARNGACMMIGGEKETYHYLEPIFKNLCVTDGYEYMGSSGSGHYVKMVHNGVEYAILQAIGEGFEILDASPYDLDLENVAKVWDNGSIIESFLMKLTHRALCKDPDLEKLEGIINASGEGLWTLQEALDLGIPTPTIADALFVRYRSHQTNTYSARLIAALRNEFGGHAVKEK